MRKGDKVMVSGTENPRFNGRPGTIVEVYGQGNQKAIVEVELEDGKIGKLLHDEEYPFSQLTPR